MTDLNYSYLDPGIRDAVRQLRQAGFNTTDSGDGVSKPKDERTFGDLPHVVSPSRAVATMSKLYEPRIWPNWKDGEALFSTATGIQVVGRRAPDRVTLESPWIWAEADWKDYAQRSRHIPSEWVRLVLLEKMEKGRAAEKAIQALAAGEAILQAHANVAAGEK